MIEFAKEMKEGGFTCSSRKFITFSFDYFQANECAIIENGPGYLTVQLTIELDKELMNRPFYWHYLEKTGGIPNPMKLTFITNPQIAPENIEGRNHPFWLSPTSPNISFNEKACKLHSGYMRIILNRNQQTPLMPWLCMNVKDFLSM